MYFRHISKAMEAWANAKDQQKPLLITGARQIGKTFVVRETLKPLCKELHVFNFEKSPKLAEIFDSDLDPRNIVSKLSILINMDISDTTDILFFDEIQAFEKAVTTLKYFKEEMPEMRVIATGSYIGLMQGFPVGQVNLLNMFPMTFEEFLIARLGDGPILKSFQKLDIENKSLFEKVWPLLLEYFYVGGLPEGIHIWLDKRDKSVVQAAESVRAYQNQLIANYALDFGKYSNKNATHISSVFRNVPYQLSKAQDGSVKKFKFKDVVNGKKSFTQLQGPIDWLDQMRVIYKSSTISEPKTPILVKDSLFRAFIFDMGMLSCMLNIPLQQHLDDNFAYKGYLAENFVANELRASGITKIYGWESEKGSAEVEFVIEVNEDKIAVPIEVKSGANTRAKSLGVYIDRYSPKAFVKLIGSIGFYHENGITLPLFYAGKIKGILGAKYLLNT
ncbi:MAG: ATP-binding protein [Chitinophagaceae bacterium]|nr:ATP-binding protein [Oligoflexus sp.]